MALTLTIENFGSLPDGGPLSHTVSGGRGFDIGRDTYLDWTLPDPNMFISGKHCEVRYKDGAYWLYDVSLNGTYLNGSDHRLLEPHRLRDGDRLGIGQYLIAVTLDEDRDAQPASAHAALRAPVSQDNIWDVGDDVAPPIDPRELRPVKPRATGTADFLDWAVDSPAPARDDPPGARSGPFWPVEPDSAWLPPLPEPVAQPAPPPVPRPDRPVWDLDAPVPFQAAPAPAREDLSRPGPRQADWPLPPEPIAPPAPPPVPRPDRPAWDLEPPAQPLPQAGSVPSETEPGRPTGTPQHPAALGTRPERPSTRPHPEPEQRAAAAPRTDFIARFAEAAGVPAESIVIKDPGELGRLLGELMAIVVAEMWELLEARRETKRMVRCSDPTMIKAENNNPLKFEPTPQDALRRMLGPPSRAYLPAGPALLQGFADLARHQVDTLAAMQGAIRMLIEDLDPREIEQALGEDRGLAAMLGSRKTKLWDIYVERWRAKTRAHDDGLIGVFMDYFSKCYDRNVAERT